MRIRVKRANKRRPIALHNWDNRRVQRCTVRGRPAIREAPDRGQLNRVRDTLAVGNLIRISYVVAANVECENKKSLSSGYGLVVPVLSRVAMVVDRRADKNTRTDIS